MSYLPNREIDLSEACFAGNIEIVKKRVSSDPSMINVPNPVNGWSRFVIFLCLTFQHFIGLVKGTIIK